MDERIEQMLNHAISDSRSTVIDNAVKIEFLINGVLSRILGLYESNSISFGNSSSALSFISKVNLLLDLSILKKDDKEKLQSFAEIRNQFAHNFMVMELKDCKIDTLKKLCKWYEPKSKIDEVKDFRVLYDNLYVDLKNAIERLIDITIEKAGKKGEELGELNYNKILIQKVDEYCKTDIGFKEKFITLINEAFKEFEENPPSDEHLESIPIL